MSNLPDLPSSDDEIWEGADKHKLEPANLFDQNHYFERIAGHQAQCRHCFWGFQLDSGDKIVEGHLFDRTGKKVL